eukprot:TRINITY_DN7166_c0_g1_i1.p1 TRINITY_DN7166_c0_g1~~TRINITY_DN7166_c0_g1_i1.p1  ORF type:complete len:308 (+),score=73.23 TRINITY_DN7166_c0_g1_i1:70-993(+)
MSFGGSGGGRKLNKAEGFAIGGLASMSAAVCTHPIDLIKVRMQLAGMNASAEKLPGPIETAMNVVRREGFFSLYKGLSASLLRQVTYSSTRFGAYGPIKELISGDDPNPSMALKLLSGMLAGACGAAVGSPADLILVRMQADGRLPVEKRVYNYSSVFNGIYRVVKNESVMDLWRGSSPTVIRAMLVTASQLSVYDVLKTFVVGNGYMKDGTAVHFSCSFIAGFVAAVATNPVDVVKTRLMNQSKASAESGVYYKGMTDCFVSTLKAEGFAGLYKGFVPNFMRLGPQTIFTFIFYEQFVKLYSWLRK